MPRTKELPGFTSPANPSQRVVHRLVDDEPADRTTVVDSGEDFVYVVSHPIEPRIHKVGRGKIARVRQWKNRGWGIEQTSPPMSTEDAIRVERHMLSVVNERGGRSTQFILEKLAQARAEGVDGHTEWFDSEEIELTLSSSNEPKPYEPKPWTFKRFLVRALAAILAIYIVVQLCFVWSWTMRHMEEDRQQRITELECSLAQDVEEDCVSPARWERHCAANPDDFDCWTTSQQIEDLKDRGLL